MCYQMQISCNIKLIFKIVFVFKYRVCSKFYFNFVKTRINNKLDIKKFSLIKKSYKLSTLFHFIQIWLKLPRHCSNTQSTSGLHLNSVSEERAVSCFLYKKKLRRSCAKERWQTNITNLERSIFYYSKIYERGQLG